MPTPCDCHEKGKVQEKFTGEDGNIWCKTCHGFVDFGK